MGRFSRKLLSAAVALSVVISGIGIVPAYADGEIISNEYVEVAPDRYVPVSEITLPTGGALDTVLYDVPTEEVERINGALEEDGAVYIPGANDLSPASSYTYSSSYFYNNVLADSNEKAFYNALTAACNAVVQSNADYTDAQHTVHYNNTNTTANIIGAVEYSGFSEDRASFIFTLFRFSNPQFYFLSNGSGSGWSSDGTNTYYYLYPQFINTYGYDFALYNTRNTAQTALDTLTLTWMTEFNAISSDLDRELAVSNKIINYLTYDDPALSNNDLLSFDQSLISGVLRQTTVCAGYTMMTAYFLNAAGIESFYVNSDGHAWNLVKLYGNWYELDNTWADQDSGANPYTWERWRNKSHAYFLSYEDEDNSHAYKSIWNGVALPTTQYDEVQVPAEPVAILKSLTATFDGKIRLNFYVDIPNDVIDGSYALLTVNGQGNKIYTSDVNYFENKGYRFSIDLLAYQVEDIVNCKIFDNNDDLITFNTASGIDCTVLGYDFSLIQYMNIMISSASTSTMKELAKRAKDYCYAAKNYFKGTSLEISADVQEVIPDDLILYDTVKNGTMPTGTTINSVTVMFDSDNSLRLYYNYDGKLPTDFSYMIDDKNAILNQRSDGKYYLEVKNIASNKLQEPHKFSISDGENTYDLTISVLSYSRGIMMNSSNENMIRLCQALYLYNQTACAHFGIN